MDYLGPLPKDNEGREYIIACCDYLTKFFVAQAVTNCSTNTSIKFLKERIISIFGAPGKLITDRAKTFCSNTFQNFLANYSIKWTPTSGYHPETNGQIER